MLRWFVSSAGLVCGVAGKFSDQQWTALQTSKTEVYSVGPPKKGVNVPAPIGYVDPTDGSKSQKMTTLFEVGEVQPPLFVTYAFQNDGADFEVPQIKHVEGNGIQWGHDGVKAYATAEKPLSVLFEKWNPSKKIPDGAHVIQYKGIGNQGLFMEKIKKQHVDDHKDVKGCDLFAQKAHLLKGAIQKMKEDGSVSVLEENGYPLCSLDSKTVAFRGAAHHRDSRSPEGWRHASRSTQSRWYGGLQIRRKTKTVVFRGMAHHRDSRSAEGCPHASASAQSRWYGVVQIHKKTKTGVFGRAARHRDSGSTEGCPHASTSPESPWYGRLKSRKKTKTGHSPARGDASKTLVCNAG